ncbi:DUF1036 domain-containing protein [Cognatishimia sp. F0-27]|uniref:DUF1036 domain-containing protein n=1 Tax=Cognatishimia sp. F0-27 TaxID=2816855 RepID=UPI001D0C671B|nr:DUF1036 domain-containing protein [Cognatishimia sp. F0-27]MCC1494100.1 DUF1036 domain-containing protein [Cognatishimia sp. F0-27]
MSSHISKDWYRKADPASHDRRWDGPCAKDLWVRVARAGRRLGTGIAVAAFAAIGTGSAAWAGVTVCNETGSARSIAIGYEASDGTWTSEGWWNVANGACQAVFDGVLGRNDLYYRAERSDESFTGPYAFCTERGAFTIRGDTDCEARGYQRTRFRKIDTGRADAFRFSIRPDGSALALIPDALPRDRPAPRRVTGALQRGQLGEPFSQTGVFVGCQTIDGMDYCGFEVEGWRYFAIYGQGTDDRLLDALQDWPVPMAVALSGDMVTYGDITVEVALGEVAEVIGGDPFEAERRALQGTWRSVDDPASVFRVVGADVYDYYNGDWTGHQWLQLVASCDGAEGLGTGVLRRELETGDAWCVIMDRYGADRIEFVNPGRGNILTYERAE